MDASLAEPRFRLRPLPLLVVAALAFAIPTVAAIATRFTVGRVSATHLPTLAWLYVHHGFQLVFALVAIGVVKRFVPTNYGLHLPRGKSYLPAAIAWGTFFGVLMTVVDYAPELLSHRVPDPGFPVTGRNVLGWMFFEGVYVGPTEEIPFRSLLVPYLMTTMPGRVRVGRFEMSWAGIVVAAIFALLHLSNFWSRPWPLALAQQAYAFALGVLYAYWLEKSKSVLAPIIGHDFSDGVEYALLFAWIAVARGGS